MSSFGVFREGEIDGEPFHIYTLISQTHLKVQPLFACLSLRFELEKLKRKEDGYSEDQVIPFSKSSDFPDRTSFDQEFQSVFGLYDKICRLPLANFIDGFYTCITCQNPSGGMFYFCAQCRKTLHKECAESPLSIKHPSYPFLSLQLYSCLQVSNLRVCVSCEDPVKDLFYHCPIYNLFMDPVCAMKPVSIIIDHSKRHPHPLTFFPKQDSLRCNVCGLVNNLVPTYVCARCVFVIHQDCIYSPNVIRISRHYYHRISFISSLPSGKWFCGVCRRKVDNDCGAYSCNKCDDYFVHSRCALRKDLWDGKELEGVDEEPDEIVVEPFKKIADGIILHFSHDHHLKLEISKDYEDQKFCQACALPIYGGNYYLCMDQCDFILHEECANSPLKTHHPLHQRPLRLNVVTNQYLNNEGWFYCSACRRQSCVFVYEDSPNKREGFKLDVRCASVSEPFEYQGHAHPLFLALSPVEEESAICQICKDKGPPDYCCRKLNCIECDFIICFKCATLPYKARYKHDNHFLTFREAKEASDDESGWCEVCERKVEYSGKGGFYTCDDYCCTTLHVDCLLGKHPYLKPGRTIDIEFKKVHVLRNNTMSRPFCHGHECDEARCLYRVVFKPGRGYRIHTMSFCSYNCAFLTFCDM